MGHVDDAHLAEGDGKADGREKQHRAEADAVGDVLQRGPERQPLLDRRDARQRRPTSRSRAGRRAANAAALRCPRRRAATRTGDRGHAVRRRGVGFMNRIAARAASSIAARRVASLSRASAASTTGKAAGSRDLNTAWAALMRSPADSDEKRQRAERRFETAADAVVETHGLERLCVGCRRSRRSWRRAARPPRRGTEWPRPASARTAVRRQGPRARLGGRMAGLGKALRSPSSVSSKRSAAKRFSASSTASARADAERGASEESPKRSPFGQHEGASSAVHSKLGGCGGGGGRLRRERRRGGSADRRTCSVLVL